MIGPEPENERRVRPLTWAAVALESEILSILARDAEPGERLEFAFRRKELELMAAFDRLTLHDSRELHRRVTLALADDPIAKLLQRFVPERRQRLATFLADARRREALRAAKCCTGGMDLPRYSRAEVPGTDGGDCVRAERKLS